MLADLLAAGPPTRKPTDAQKASNVLVYDIETFPALVQHHLYDLKMRNPYVHHSNVIRPGGMLAWSAHWLHEPGVVHYADIHDPRMHERLWELLDSSSYRVTYNGDRFDEKKVRGYFARQGFPPPRPSKSIDLIKTVRTFGLESNSLDYACRMFGTEHQKLVDIGAGGWQGVIDGDPHARKMMRRYATHDVRATTDLYLSLLPWIPNHPHMGFAAEDDQLRCPRCGSADITDVGAYQAVVVRYRQHRCGSCSGLLRSLTHSRAGRSRAV